MGWPKGKCRGVKTGGRVKGTPNQRSLLFEEELRRLEFDLPSRILDLLPELSPDKQMDAMLRLMEFVFPKRRLSDDTPPAKIVPAQIQNNLALIFADSRTTDAAKIVAEKLAEMTNDDTSR